MPRKSPVPETAENSPVADFEASLDALEQLVEKMEHGELSLEQLFFNRPVPGYARFRTPVRDLWLCGSATHPGGGIMGANGRIAALEVLRARGRKAA